MQPMLFPLSEERITRPDCFYAFGDSAGNEKNAFDGRSRMPPIIPTTFWEERMIGNIHNTKIVLGKILPKHLNEVRCSVKMYKMLH